MQFDETVEKASAKPPLQLRDAELLLSYLTVPYLRIPLLLTFFADQQRLTALSSIRMQQARSLVHIINLPVVLIGPRIPAPIISANLYPSRNTIPDSTHNSTITQTQILLTNVPQRQPLRQPSLQCQPQP